MVSKLADHFVDLPHVEWEDGRPFAISRLSEEYANILEELALAKENAIKTLPISPGWEPIAKNNPTTARYSSYSAFLLSPVTLPLFFAIRETYRQLLQALRQEPAPRFIQCWYNVHRVEEALVRHKHPYPFIGTFSAHAEGSETRYGKTRETSASDVIVPHVRGQLMVTTGAENYHETSVWRDPTRARVTYAFDILGPEQWNSRQIFLPFDL
jgi:hypothetical protein